MHRGTPPTSRIFCTTARVHQEGDDDRPDTLVDLRTATMVNFDRLGTPNYVFCELPYDHTTPMGCMSRRAEHPELSRARAAVGRYTLDESRRIFRTTNLETKAGDVDEPFGRLTGIDGLVGSMDLVCAYTSHGPVH
jgi:hypothetical protein